MSVEFKIKDWRFEIDWKGILAEPITGSADRSVLDRQHQHDIRRPSTPKASIRKQTERIRKQTEEGENEAWV